MPPTPIIIASIVAAVIPTLIYIGIIYWIDQYEKEPWWLLTSAFLWGAIPSIGIAFLFNSFLSIPIYLLAGEGAGDAVESIFIAPPVEESIKGIALLGILFLWRHEIDSPLDGIIYGAMVGMGFAMVENVYYFLSVYAEGGSEAWGVNIFLRGVIFGLNHALFTSMTGLGIAIARMARRDSSTRFAAPAAGWALAVFLHSLHNATVASGNLLCVVALIFDWGGVLLTLAIIVWALVQERRWIETYLVEEVKLETLTFNQYERAHANGLVRGWHNLGVLFSQGVSSYLQTRRFYQYCSELAYKKHHLSLFADDKTRRMVEELREEIAQFGRSAP